MRVERFWLIFCTERRWNGWNAIGRTVSIGAASKAKMRNGTMERQQRSVPFPFRKERTERDAGVFRTIQIRRGITKKGGNARAKTPRSFKTAKRPGLFDRSLRTRAREAVSLTGADRHRVLRSLRESRSATRFRFESRALLKLDAKQSKREVVTA